MKKYIQNTFTSFIYGGIFGIIYNIVIYLLSEKIFAHHTDFFRYLPILLYEKVSKETLWAAFEVMQNEYLLIILSGFFSNIIDLILYGLIFMLLIRKVDSPEIKLRIWKKVLIFIFFSTLAIAVIFFIGTYIWAVNNKDVSWFPSDVVFEWHLPTIYFAENKSTYLFFSFILSLLLYPRIKRKVVNNTIS